MSIRPVLKVINSIKRKLNLKKLKTILASFVAKKGFSERKFIIDVMNVISITATSATIEVETLT